MNMILHVAAVALLTGGSIAAGDVDCKALGFISNQLACSTCDGMSTFEGLTEEKELLAACRSCCTEAQAEDTIYDEAILRLSERSLISFPQIGGFVKHHLTQYPAVRIQWVTRGYPSFTLIKDSKTRGVEKIWSWNEDQIRSFARLRLDNDAARARGDDNTLAAVLPSRRKSRSESAGLSDEYLDLLFPASGGIGESFGNLFGSGSAAASGSKQEKHEKSEASGGSAKESKESKSSSKKGKKGKGKGKE